jgi:hypothetical protein
VEIVKQAFIGVNKALKPKENLLCRGQLIPYIREATKIPLGILEAAIRIVLTLATTFLFGIVFLAYLRLRSRKMLLISVGFGVFLFHAVITLPELINEAYAIMLTEDMHLFIHLVGLIFIILGILKD